MKFYDRNTGIYIADSNEDLLACTAVSYGEIKDLLSGYILSVSGWRAVFARSKDENDHDADVGDGDRIIAAAAASAFFSYLSKDHPRILIDLHRPPPRLGGVAAEEHGLHQVVDVRTGVPGGQTVRHLLGDDILS